MAELLERQATDRDAARAAVDSGGPGPHGDAGPGAEALAEARALAARIDALLPLEAGAAPHALALAHALARGLADQLELLAAERFVLRSAARP